MERKKTAFLHAHAVQLLLWTWYPADYNDAIKIPDQFRPFVNDYRINLFDISRLPGEAVGYFHSDFKIIVDYFVGKRDNPEYRPKDPQKFKHVDEVLKMLSVFTGDSRFSDFITQEGGRPVTMCEVLDRAENKGKENARLEAIRNIMESLQITAREAMALLKLPEEDWPMYESRL